MKVPFETCIFKSYPEGSVTQFFGENPALYSKVCPAPGQCLVGGHNGIDLVAPWGTPIFAVQDGIVCEVKDSPTGYGKHVRILSDHDDTAFWREWTYGHLSRLDVTIGQQVSEGQVIGLMGNTGFVVSGATPYWEYNPFAGTHLHLAARIVQKVEGTNPHNIQYSASQRGIVQNYDNGFFGSVDFKSWFVV